MDASTFCSQKFTHLIIGGGTAGLVVAARLSENPALHVGVLEAGSFAWDEPRINVPGRFGETLGTKYDWQFETTEQAALGGRKIPCPRGKVLGGTSAMNFMTWNRGCREDYDAWVELGCEGWGWDSLLPFFKKSEDFHTPDADHQTKHQSHFTPDFHGLGGPLQATYSTEYSASHAYWHETLHNLDVKTNRSHFSGSNVGVWTSLTSVHPADRERCYSATAYYKPYRGRGNLMLLTEAMVQEIVLEDSGDGEYAASAVRFEHDGQDHIVRVGGEIVLCAGTIQSPQLLELSGIGNSDILNSAGVEVKVPNPNVGENLQDHIMTMMVFEIDPSIATSDDLRTDPNLAAAADEAFVLTKSGPRTAIPSSVAYLPFSHFMSPDELATLANSLQGSTTSSKRDQILLDRLKVGTSLGQIEYNFDTSNYSAYFKPRAGKKYATMMQMLQYPFSRGSIHIHSKESDGSAEGFETRTSSDHPIINPRYYEGPGGEVDYRLMVASQRFADRICRTEPLKSIIVSRVFPEASSDGDELRNGAQDHATIRDQRDVVEAVVGPRGVNGGGVPPKRGSGMEEGEDFSEWVRQTTVHDWHPVGTCAMGVAPSLGGSGVVDHRLRVHGVKRLRVCDASVMPLQVSAHLQATVYAIGEKGAAMMLEDWEGAVEM